jgi:hypothetical protein
MFSPTGQMDEEIQYLKGRSTQWMEKTRMGFLKNFEAWICLQTTIMTTIEYALPATTMSRKELGLVMSPIVNIGLAKSGICRKLARSIVYAPHKYEGLELRHHYDTQGINKLETMFHTGQVMIYNLVEATWARTKAECGLGDDFLQKDGTYVYDVVTEGRILSL